MASRKKSELRAFQTHLHPSVIKMVKRAALDNETTISELLNDHLSHAFGVPSPSRYDAVGQART